MNIQSPLAALRRRVVRFHRDDRGAISVLVLLTMWCFVALLAMVWNNAEQSVRRQQVQAAADAAAHASAQWMSRSINTINAQNILICQDASTEAIWRAVSATDRAIATRLTGEIAAAQQMKNGNAFNNLRNQILRQRAIIADEYELTIQPLQVLMTGSGANFPRPQDAQNYLATVQQAQGALTTLNNTTVQQLLALADNLPPTLTNQQVLDYIINFIQTSEQPILRSFEAQTAAATAQPVDSQMAAHEAQIYGEEMAMADSIPDAIEATRQQLADACKVDLTLATLNPAAGPSPSSGPARILAPLKSAQDRSLAVPIPHIDAIRMTYPQEALDANLLPVVLIDPINPHTDDNRIWHPDLSVAVDPALRAQYPRLRASYTVRCDEPGGWGHIWVAPLERYLFDRVSRDSAPLNGDFMEPLDRSRTPTLRDAIHTMLFGSPGGAVPVIPPIPATLNIGGVNVPVLPALLTPATANGNYATQVSLYNTHSSAYVAAVRNLRSFLQSYSGIYDRFTLPFASSTWTANVTSARDTVAKNLGDSRQFMVLQTYNLFYIPDWARDSMQASAQTAIENQIIVRSMPRVTFDLIRDGVPDIQAAAIAYQVVYPAAHQAAGLIAGEIVSRPWPYELTPPALPVPPVRGISKDDLRHYFSLIAVARETAAVAPRLIAPKLFNPDGASLIAYAQAETFNWMEFNSPYGQVDRFDAVTAAPWQGGGGGEYRGSPMAWRISTVGGWNWRARLSLSDALSPALQNNPELAAYFQEAGLNAAPPPETLDEINLH